MSKKRMQKNLVNMAEARVERFRQNLKELTVELFAGSSQAIKELTEAVENKDSRE